MPTMTDSELRAMLASQYAGAMAASSASKLSEERADALSYYNGDVSNDMPAMPGRSSAVSMDVSDTIEGMMPQLMEIFCGTDEVVKFEPVGPEDEKAAEQETDYINHVFMNQNPGFLALYSFIKDALMSKVGVVKVWWEKTEREEKETYLDKTEDEYALIVANPDVEVVAHTEHAAEPAALRSNPNDDSGGNSAGQGGVAPAPVGLLHPNAGGQVQTLHDVTVVTKKTTAIARVMGVPPEEFGIEAGARTIRDCNYCFHKIVDRTEADLIEQGYDEIQVKKLPSYRAWSSTEEVARSTVREESTGTSETNTGTRRVEITEHYVRMDYEKNGKTCLYQVTTGGKGAEILRKDGKLCVEEFDAIPFAAMTPVIVTHRFYGKSLADLVMDIMRIKTALIRGALDSMYMALNRRIEVSESHATENTLDDLLVSRPNGLVRTKMPGGLREIDFKPIGNEVYTALEYQDQRLETRTGVSKRGQGVEPDALLNQSATAAKIVDNASQARVRLIARIFAETGIRDLFWLLHATIKKHGQQAQAVRLRNQWVTVDPREWKSREDLTVHVGLGTGGRQQRVAELTVIGNVQEKLVLGGFTNIVGPTQLYTTGKELTKAIGMRNPDEFFADPGAKDQTGQLVNPPPPPKPDPKIIEIQMQGQLAEQADQRKAQLDGQALQQKAQIETVQAQADIATQNQKTQAEMAMAERKAQLEERLMLLDHELKREMHAAELQMKRELHEHTLAQGQLSMAATAQSHDAKMEQMKSKPQPGAK